MSKANKKMKVKISCFTDNETFFFMKYFNICTSRLHKNISRRGTTRQHRDDFNNFYFKIYLFRLINSLHQDTKSIENLTEAQ